MKKLIISSILVTFAFLSFTACDNEDKANANKPEITFLSPQNDAAYDLGGQIKVKADIKAEEGIKQIKIDIHYGEGHSHDSNGTIVGDNKEVILVEKIIEANGKIIYNLDEEFDIPLETPEGHYHVGILVTDLQNRIEKEYRTVVIGEDHDHE